MVAMRFTFQNLNSETRRYMLEELDLDESQGTLYMGKRLNHEGRRRYPEFLRQALKDGDPYTLAAELGEVPGQFWVEAITAKNNRRSTTPRTAPLTLAEGQFNRFYMRGLARRAIDEGLGLEITRAKPVKNPRPESEALRGCSIDPEKLLEELRKDPESTPYDFHLGNPNSGLTVRLT